MISVGVVIALATSETSGTGATNVGDVEDAAPSPASPSASPETTAAAPEATPRTCRATRSNPGGDNNYLADAPRKESLGEGFVVTGEVRSAAGCRPLEGVPVQVWLPPRPAASRTTAPP